MNVLDTHLVDFDPEIATAIELELQRQRGGLEMIAYFAHIAEIIATALIQAPGEATAELSARVGDLAARYPLYRELT